MVSQGDRPTITMWLVSYKGDGVEELKGFKTDKKFWQPYGKRQDESPFGHHSFDLHELFDSEEEALTEAKKRLEYRIRIERMNLANYEEKHARVDARLAELAK